MRAAVLAQGLHPAAADTAVEAALAAAPQPAVYRMRQGVADAVTEMRRDLPRGVKTWEPYLQLYVDGLPDTCPCPCPACATGPCACPGGAADHREACAMSSARRRAATCCTATAAEPASSSSRPAAGC